MEITLLTYGSQGDVEPFLALARGLIDAGHRVNLAAPEYYKERINISGIEFFGYPGNPQQLVKDLVDEAGRNWADMIRSVSRFVIPLASAVVNQSWKASENADLIIHSFLLTSTGFEIAQEKSIPDISAQTFPVFSNTSDFPAPVFPDLPLGNLYRRFSHHFVTQTFKHGSNILYRWIRKANPDLPPLTAWPFQKGSDWQTPILYAFSPNVISRPEDWPENVHITGYWFSQRSSSWKPQKDLEDFIEAGPLPVAVVFGSTRSKKIARIIQMIVEALLICNQRGVIVTDDQIFRPLNPSVCQVDYVPYDWLFERSAAVIHHGGAGTTGKGLQAGVPNILIPFTSDQPFWGDQVFKLGVGPKPLAPGRLTVNKLVNAIKAVTQDQNIRNRARLLGAEMEKENGIAQAIEIILKLTKTPKTTKRSEHY